MLAAYRRPIEDLRHGSSRKVREADERIGASKRTNFGASSHPRRLKLLTSSRLGHHEAELGIDAPFQSIFANNLGDVVYGSPTTHRADTI